MPTVNLKLPEGERPAPEPLNYFQFSRVGVEVQMLAGWIDLQRAAAAMEENPADVTAITVSPEITHRLVFSLQGLELLRTQINELWEKMSASIGEPEAGE